MSTPACPGTPTWSACCPGRSSPTWDSTSGSAPAPSPRTRPPSATARPTGLLVGGGEERTREAFVRLTGSDREYRAWQDFYDLTGRVARRVFPTLTEPLPTREELRRTVDDEEAWRILFEQPLGVAVEERFSDDLVRGVVLTDALIGTFADAHEPSLKQNRCFLYHVIGGGTGAWDVPVGGMGAVTDALADAARAAGAVVATGHEAVRIETDGRTAEVTHRTSDGEGVVTAGHVLVNASPEELARLTGDTPPPHAEGAQLKVNMLLTRLPRLRDSSVDPREAFAGTFHIAEGYQQLATAHDQAAAAGFPTRRPRRSTATRSPTRPSSDPSSRRRATRPSPCSDCTRPRGCSNGTTTRCARSC